MFHRPHSIHSILAPILLIPVLLGTLCQQTSVAQENHAEFGAVQCEGIYRHHLQGICSDEKKALFWSFTTELVKTDAKGQVLKKIPVENHHGDLCYADGKIYVAVNLGQFNQPTGKADSWVFVYRADDLSLLSKHQVPEVVHGAGGMAYHDGVFVVVGGLPEGVEENYAYAYSPDFKFLKRHVLKSGYTRLGVQTLAFHDGQWWFGCYGKQLLVTDSSFQMKGRFDFDCALGIVGIAEGKFLVARGSGSGYERGGSAVTAVPDAEKGLVLQGKQQGD